MFWFVCRKVVLFPVLLHQKKIFFLFAASRADFYLNLLNTAFSFVSG